MTNPSKCNSEYFPKTLLLTNAERSGLLLLPGNNSHIVINLEDGNNYSIFEISRCKCHPINDSLHELGSHYLNLTDTTFDTMLRYLVTPEMEVERIFNCLRFKYLLAIYLSGFDTPGKYISSQYNKAFQTLAGLKVYQGGAKQRKDNDAYWQEAGFSVAAKKLNWGKERVELQTILALIKRISPHSITRNYAELIAIKPGFHEMYLHHDYFDMESIPDGTSPRDTVFRMLRNKEVISSLDLHAFPSEINKNSYFSYAPCTITEGPFVFRKNVSVNYYDAIRSITSKRKIRSLKNQFHILDYYHADLSTNAKLGSFLELAKLFCGYLT